MAMSEEMIQQLKEFGAEPLEMSDVLQFECQPSCWGTCCTGIDILMTPFDVYRLAQGAGLTMVEFINRHCNVFPGGSTGWPIARLAKAAKGRCEFLDMQGRCTVRDSRPSVCRASPIGPVRDTSGHAGVMLKLPHSMCQKKNSAPVSAGITVGAFLNANNVQEWWDGGDLYHGTMLWAIKELKFSEWASDVTYSVMARFMFNADQMVPPGTSEAEMHRRVIEVLKAILPRMAAGYGHGPLAGEGSLEASATAALVAVQIMETGTYDEEKAREQADAMRPKGFMVVDPHESAPIKTFPSFDLDDAKALLAFLTEEARKFRPLHRWLVVLDSGAQKVMSAEDLLMKSKRAALKQHQQRRAANA